MSTASFEYGFSACRAGPGRLHRHPQPVGDRVVQERLVDADQLPAGGRDVRRRARRQPAHELQDGRLDLAPEEQPAVAGQGVPDAIGQLADDPEVDVADRVARQDEQVGRVQVGVEVAEHVDLVEHVPVEVADDPVQVVAAGGERLEIGGVALALGDHDRRSAGCRRSARWSARATSCSRGGPGRSARPCRPARSGRAGRPGAPRRGSRARRPSSARTRR